MGVSSYNIVYNFDQYRAVFHDDSYTSGLTNVRVNVYNESGLVSISPMVEIAGSGIYYKDLSLSTGNYILMKNDIISGYKMPAEKLQVVDGTMNDTIFNLLYSSIIGLYFGLEPTLLSIQSTVQFLRSVEIGDWKLEGSQLVFRDKSTGAELARFDLLDASGNPTTDKEEVNEVQGV